MMGARSRTLGAALLLCACAAVATAAPWKTSGVAEWTRVPDAGPEPAFSVPRAQRSRLANGIALLVVENHKLPLVAMTLVVDGAGAAADPPGKTGLASYTADLLDEGAGGMTALQIGDALDRLGATVTPTTMSDGVTLDVSTLSKNLDATIDLVTRIVTAPSFDAGEAERVRGDRVTWLELRRDRPREVAGLVLSAGLYGERARYGHPTAGYLADVKSLSAEDARRFHRDAWHAERMTLVVAGDVDPVALRKRLDATLGAWTRPRVAKDVMIGMNQRPSAARLYLVDRAGAEQADIRMGLVGITQSDPRYYRFEVLRTLLGDGFTSRLNQRLREQLGYTYGIRAGISYRREPGPFTIATALFTPKTTDGLREILQIIDGLAHKDVPGAELMKAKQNMIRALPSQFETSAGMAAAFADLALLGLPDDWYETYAREVKKVTASDVREAARTLLPSGKLVTVVVGDLEKLRPGLEKLGLGTPVVKGPSGE